jgi:hypothetical protein
MKEGLKVYGVRSKENREKALYLEPDTFSFTYS